MTFPVVGLIAGDWARAVYENEGRKLGVGVKFGSSHFSPDQLIEFSKDCQLLCVEPDIISISVIKTVERSGVRIYPSSKTLEQLSLIEKTPVTGDCFSILIARSAHNQIACWPATLVTNNLTITPPPGVSNDQLEQIQLSAFKLVAEIDLIGAFELLVDAADYKKLVKINWLTPLAQYWSQIGSITNYFEQYLKAVLDLPLGSTNATKEFIITGKLITDQSSDDYRPYLHLMARNPDLKFDQSSKQVGIAGSDLERLLTEIIHAQQYYSGEIDE